MMIVYMKNIAYEKAFDLIDELKELCREKKNIVCELEQALRQCMEYGENEEFDDSEDYDNDIDDDLYDDDDSINSRNMRGSRRPLRKNISYRNTVAEHKRSMNRKSSRFV